MKKITETKVALRFINTVKAINLDLDGLESELLDLHSKRRVHKLNVSVGPEKIRDAVGREIAYRSRVVSILWEVDAILRNVKAMMDATVLRLVTVKDYHVLMKHLTTKTDRQLHIRNELKRICPDIEKMERVVDLASYVLEDIDQASWGLKTIIESYRLESKTAPLT